MISLWMRAGFPIFAIENSVYDDDLFIKLARSIGNGHWLGHYDNATLVKGAFYPVFIAAAHAAHLPLKIAEQLVYIGASFIISNLVATRLPRGKALGTALFALLCLNPVLWYPDLARVLREGLYVGLSLGVLGLAAAASFPPARGSPSRAIVTGLLLGSTAGAFWTTREEGVWLVPAVAAVGAMGLARQWLSLPAGLRSPSCRWPGRLLASWLAAAAAFCAVVGLISALNLHRYGVFETVEVNGAAFRRGYGALTRIKPDQWQRYVVFPRDVRERAYAVSPAARELAPVLDGPVGQRWARERCEGSIEPCTGIHAGWFQWAFREAVAQAGHYASARTALAYYERLAAEIDAACAEGRLDCLPPRATLAQPFRWHYLGDAWQRAGATSAWLLGMGSDDRQLETSNVSRRTRDNIEDLAGPVIPDHPTRFVARGWVGAPGSAPSVHIRPRGLPHVDSRIDYAPAGDVEAAQPGLRATRFLIDTDCPPAACDVVLSGPDLPGVAIPLTAFAQHSMPLQGAVKVFVDEAATDTAFLARAKLGAFQASIAHRISRAYAAACRTLWPLACAGLLVTTAFRRRCDAPAVVYALAVGCAIAVACRIALVSYLDVTAIPFNPSYLAVASPFLIGFVTLGLYLGSVTLASLVRSRSGREPVPT